MAISIVPSILEIAEFASFSDNLFFLTCPLNHDFANDNDLFHFGIKVDGEYPHKHIGDIQYKANEGDVYWAVRDY